jgi:hypothetical protein
MCVQFVDFGRYKGNGAWESLPNDFLMQLPQLRRIAAGNTGRTKCHFIWYGKGGEIAVNNKEDQEIAILSLHLLQICMVYINTLLVQKVLSEEDWLSRMQPEDFRGLTPLFYSHINPYGRLVLDMDERIIIE